MSGQSSHPLEEWTRQTFGEVFAQFVLHGLLSDAQTRTGRIRLEGAGLTRQKWLKTIAFVKLRPEAWGYKPLVLAALLKQLVGRPEVERTLSFTFKALLDDLIWPDVPAMWRVVRDALVSYQQCQYSPDGVDEGSSKLRGMRVHHTLLTQLDIITSSPRQRVRFSDQEHTASFNPDFIDGLRRGKVVFAGTDFGELSVGRAAPGAGGRPHPRGTARTAAPPPECPFRPPGPTPALLFEVTPLSLGPSDLWSNVEERAVGKTTISIDTGAKANAVLRLVKRVVARHPPELACPPEWFGAVAEYVCRETDRRFREVCARSRRLCPSVSSKTLSCRAGA